ncbi:MAG: hypothetical protein A2144_03030 [Chloroflexi bacterium RBG_16_50_9]|nr:MAG: hypothetical protein A2144_03030 [Chloroflexi bacterium RBG_16_50_9]
MITWFILIVAAYLLGSLPTAYLVAKRRGVDLRQHGTKQVGGGNLWRTTSRKLGLLVGLFDFIKGMVMIVVAQLQGLDVAQQAIIGLAAIVGHNWPVFLRFHGGRGISTLLGIVLVLPAINEGTPWPAVIALGIVIVGTVIMRSSPFPVFVGAASLPLTYWISGGGIAVTMAFLAIFLIIILKRLTAQPSAEAASISTSKLLLNRLLFDRDISDRKVWIQRKPGATEEPREDGL